MFLNSKTAKAFALATGALLLPTAAAHAEEVTMERDGVTYVYTVTPKTDRTIITGKANRMTPFRLVVRGERVTGEYNNRSVAFSLSEAKAGAAEVAVR